MPPAGTLASSRCASAVFATGVRPTRRMTSPSVRPARAAGLLGSTSTTTAPRELSSPSWRAMSGVMLFSVRPNPAVVSGSGPPPRPPRPARDCWLPSASRSSSSTVTLIVCSLPSRITRSGTLVPGFVAVTIDTSSLLFFTGLPL